MTVHETEWELWALAPIADCHVDQPCVNASDPVRWCGGCIGTGRRIATGVAIPVWAAFNSDGTPFALYPVVSDDESESDE